jgi:hypothetical protein
MTDSARLPSLMASVAPDYLTNHWLPISLDNRHCHIVCMTTSTARPHDKQRTAAISARSTIIVSAILAFAALGRVALNTVVIVDLIT